jgi:pyruvate, water dikinase
MSATVSWFADIGLADRPQVGGKGGSLGELTRAGIPVPPGFVVRTQAFEEFLGTLERAVPVRARVAALAGDDLASIEACSRELREHFEHTPLPQSTAAAIGDAHATLMKSAALPVAVRSSATTEDAGDASFAGQQDTYLYVMSAQECLTRVRSCWASLYSVESISYRRRRNFPEPGVAMAVVVQTMVDARTAGVMFTRSPTTGDRSVVTIEGAWGLGSAVVSGEVTPDRWVIGKITGEITVRTISDKQTQHLRAANGGIEAVAVPEERRQAASLSDSELEALRQLARRIERHYGTAQDIEWAIDQHSGEIRLLQSRPETVWSGKEANPVASPSSNPLLHVMNVFGGRR